MALLANTKLSTMTFFRSSICIGKSNSGSTLKKQESSSSSAAGA